MSDELTGSLVIYQTDDGRATVECRLVDETIWLSQALMGELFDRSKKTISEHLRNIFEEGELDPDSVVWKFRTTAAVDKSKEFDRGLGRRSLFNIAEVYLDNQIVQSLIAQLRWFHTQRILIPLKENRGKV